MVFFRVLDPENYSKAFRLAFRIRVETVIADFRGFMSDLDRFWTCLGFSDFVFLDFGFWIFGFWIFGFWIFGFFIFVFYFIFLIFGF